MRLADFIDLALWVRAPAVAVGNFASPFIVDDEAFFTDSSGRTVHRRIGENG